LDNGILSILSLTRDCGTSSPKAERLMKNWLLGQCDFDLIPHGSMSD